MNIFRLFLLANIIQYNSINKPYFYTFHMGIEVYLLNIMKIVRCVVGHDISNAEPTKKKHSQIWAYNESIGLKQVYSRDPTKPPRQNQWSSQIKKLKCTKSTVVVVRQIFKSNPNATKHEKVNDNSHKNITFRLKLRNSFTFSITGRVN